MGVTSSRDLLDEAIGDLSYLCMNYASMHNVGDEVQSEQKIFEIRGKQYFIKTSTVEGLAIKVLLEMLHNRINILAL